jgi:hypothetical protein
MAVTSAAAATGLPQSPVSLQAHSSNGNGNGISNTNLYKLQRSDNIAAATTTTAPNSLKYDSGSYYSNTSTSSVSTGLSTATMTATMAANLSMAAATTAATTAAATY